MASILENLQTQGWYLTADGLKKICESEKLTDVRTISRKALDYDIREIGAPILETEIYKTNFGPVVLQVVKLRNASAPKSKQTSQGAPRMLKLILTDGHLNCPAFEFRPLPFLSPDKTSPGTKLLISGAQVTAGSILLSPENCKLLGGTVPSLIDKWEISKLMPNHVRVNDDGPPAWVNFGKKIVSSLSNQSFKSLETKNKDNTKENSEFQNQRQDAIAEAAQGAVKKVFGGGVKPPTTLTAAAAQEPPRFNNNKPDKIESREQRAPRQPKQKGKDKSEPEKMEKPSQRVSLFDFLENKLPPSAADLPQTKPQVNTDIPKFGKANQKPINKVNRNSYINRPENFNSSRQDYNNYNNPRQDYNNARQDYNNPRQDYNNTRQDYNNARQDGPSRADYQSHQRQENHAQKYASQDNRYHQNDRPPRFQKQQQQQQQRPETSTNKFNQNPGGANPQFMNTEPAPPPRSKPNTNQFVDKLTNEMNTISLYNSKYENEKLNVNKSNKKMAPPFKEPRIPDTTKPWKWKVGDRCMAKYWEDDKFYNAVVTGITTKTCMVEFMEYGNFEEVLHCDCIPVTAEEQENVPDRNKNNNQQFSGSLEFRRGKNRPFVRTPNKTYGQNRNYES